MKHFAWLILFTFNPSFGQTTELSQIHTLYNRVLSVETSASDRVVAIQLLQELTGRDFSPVLNNIYRYSGEDTLRLDWTGVLNGLAEMHDSDSFPILIEVLHQAGPQKTIQTLNSKEPLVAVFFGIDPWLPVNIFFGATQNMLPQDLEKAQRTFGQLLLDWSDELRSSDQLLLRYLIRAEGTLAERGFAPKRFSSFMNSLINDNLLEKRTRKTAVETFTQYCSHEELVLLARSLLYSNSSDRADLYKEFLGSLSLRKEYHRSFDTIDPEILKVIEDFEKMSSLKNKEISEINAEFLLQQAQIREIIEKLERRRALPAQCFKLFSK